ncbi:MAG: DUF4358 domain-containing protein, partial [Clostridiales bacterium]
ESQSAEEDNSLLLKVAGEMEDALGQNSPKSSLDDTLLQKLYNIDIKDVKHYVGFIPQMVVDAEEFLLIEACPGKAAQIEVGIQYRLLELDQAWRDYQPQQYQLVKDYHLIRRGDIFFFVISPKADLLEEIFVKHFPLTEK